jgi:GNAT superfamily N-acetyltransferase
MIREATREDRPALVAMAEHFLAGTAYGALLRASGADVGRLVDAILEHQLGAIAVADVDGAVVGFIALFISPSSLTLECFADEIAWWVEPVYRSGTLGPQLLSWSEDWARRKSLRVIKMVAPAGSRVGVFYKRAGYVALETSFVKVLADGVPPPATHGDYQPDV